MSTRSEKDQFLSSLGDDGNSESWLVGNSPQKNVKIETGCNDETDLVDRISHLPHALIVQILSRLSIIDAFRTSILSKDWRYFWTAIDNLVYDNEEFNCSDSSMVHKFISLTDNVLPLLSSSSIKKCSLNFVFRHNDEVSYFPVIDKWLEFAVNKKVEGLSLKISYDTDDIENDQPYSLPKVFCSSSSIQKLKCQNCRILDDCVLNWTSLKILTLEDLLIQDKHISQIMSNSPQLESFSLYKFCGFNYLHMTSPNCKKLKLIDHYHPTGDWFSFEGDCCFEVVAPYVEHLTIFGDFDYTIIELKDLSSLDHAKLDLCSDEFDSLDEGILIDLLVSVGCANELILSSWFIKVSYQFQMSLVFNFYVNCE
ncbi:F-box/LRR-repeat protein 25-like [Solanum lycopersicum]|uniref:F-box/LRR-repeat protein 25-like n=1 Tax=Solanum lycopersicum TaxID=4081 RepID=UPI000532CC39|nr:putative F-box/LRR-repeat protein At3g28410 [Solanum lycopersicum]